MTYSMAVRFKKLPRSDINTDLGKLNLLRNSIKSNCAPWIKTPRPTTVYRCSKIQHDREIAGNVNKSRRICRRFCREMGWRGGKKKLKTLAPLNPDSFRIIEQRFSVMNFIRASTLPIHTTYLHLIYPLRCLKNITVAVGSVLRF